MNVRMLLSMLFLSWSATYGQVGQQRLSLTEAINAAVEGNKVSRNAKLDEKVALSKYKQTNAVFLPQANLSYTALASDNPLNAFGFKLQQRSVTAADFNPSVLNNPGSRSDFLTRLEVQQPLLNMDLLYMRKSTAKQVEMYTLISKRTDDHISLEVEKAYLQLQMAYEVEKLMKEALSTAKEVNKNAENYFKQGLIQRSDLLNTELHVLKAETGLKNARSNVASASDLLGMLMNKPLGSLYTTDPMAEESLSGDSLRIPDNRADLLAREKGIEAYDLMGRSARMSIVPKLNGFASYQFNDNKMFGFGNHAYLAGVQLSWNIFSGTRNRELSNQYAIEKEKNINQLQLAKEEANLQLNQAVRMLDDARFSIAQQKKAVEQASESFRVTQNRFAQGLAKTSDVLMAQSQLAEQKMQLAQAQFNFHTTLAQLKFLTKEVNNK